MKKEFISVVCALCIVPQFAMATTNYQYKSYQPDVTNYSQSQPLKGHIVNIPAGTPIAAVTRCEFSSANLTQGQSVDLFLGDDFYYNSELIAPKGSTVVGTVSSVKKATLGTINGELKIVFNKIITPQGNQIQITGLIGTNDGSGVLVGGTKMDSVKKYTKDAVIGTAAGALSGVVFGALSGGSVGLGAALGTAVGAGGGLAVAGLSKGVDVVIPSNSIIDIVLIKPSNATTTNYANHYEFYQN